MSGLKHIQTLGNRFSLVINTTRASTIRYPEWWTWLLSLYIWGWLLSTSFLIDSGGSHSGRLIYCMTNSSENVDVSTVQLKSILNESVSFSGITASLSKGFLPWVIMIVAMMFPLLNEAVRHMAFSVKRSDRDLGILAFLAGYTIIWTVAGVFFLLIPFGIDVIFGARSPLVDVVLTSSVFLLTAIISWLPSRSITMARCAQTMPIRIHKRYLYTDGVSYGALMGIACIRMCWLPMTALMLAHHSVLLMFIVTFIVIIERYFVPHSSKIPSYGFGIIAVFILGYGLYMYF